jgi:hypothetical protein
MTLNKGFEKVNYASGTIGNYPEYSKTAQAFFKLPSILDENYKLSVKLYPTTMSYFQNAAKALTKNNVKGDPTVEELLSEAVILTVSNYYLAEFYSQIQQYYYTKEGGSD